MFILGLCITLNLTYSGCCKWWLSPECFHNGCYCDQWCYKWNRCCRDIADIGCHPILSSSLTLTSTNMLGKINQ